MSVLKDLRPVKLMMFSRMDTLRLNSSSVEVSNCICSSISPLSPSSLLPQKCGVLGAKSPPPVSILKHNPKITSPPSQLWKKRARACTTLNERQFNEYNFSIERIQPGNGGLYNAVDAVSDAGTFLDKA